MKCQLILLIKLILHIKCRIYIICIHIFCNKFCLFIYFIGYIVEMSHTFDYFFNIMGITSMIVMAVLIIQINFSTFRKCFHFNSKVSINESKTDIDINEKF